MEKGIFVGKRMRTPGTGRRVSVLLMLVLALMLVPLSGKTQAAQKTGSRNMVKAAKNNTVRKKKARLITRNGKIRLRYTDTGKYAKDEWLTYGGNIYYFGKKGYARTGFFKYNKKVYYADETGNVLHRKWINIKGKSYYLKWNGVRATKEKIEYRGITYKFNKKGVMVSSDAEGIKYLFVGDSRIVGMAEAAPGSDTKYIGKVSMGYSWLVYSASHQVRSVIKANPSVKVIFCFGVNDPDNIYNYISFYKNMVEEYPRATFYFLSVNPLYRGNNRVLNFNSKLKKAFKERYVDSYSYLARTGYDSWDGIHYSADTYRKIYKFVLKKIR